jgi:uncharacterized damage-inducible protein DinB
LSGIRGATLLAGRAARAYTLRVDPLAHHLLTQAFNNAWANHRLLGACAQLSPAEFGAPRTGFFPSIKATLNHNLTVDWYYIDAIERSLAGRPPNDAFMAFYEPEEPFAVCAELQAAQHASDRRLIALCEPLDAAALARIVVVPRSAGLTREPLPRLLAHLFQHQVHHRGQAHSMLSGTPVAPPQLDEFFCTWDAPLRVDDFRALGFSEAAIWPAE